MPSLVTRFHLLLLTVTAAITGVALLHIPSTFDFPAHWHRGGADWLWPRDIALAVAPTIQIALMAAFHLLGLALTKNHLAKTRHILDPALTLLLAVATACQMSLLFLGIGSDLDLFRGTAALLSATLLILSVVIFEAERHSYAGLRMPWPIPSDRAWSWVHRVSGFACGACAVLLAVLVWQDVGPGILVVAMTLSLVTLPLIAAIATLMTRRL